MDHEFRDCRHDEHLIVRGLEEFFQECIWIRAPEDYQRRKGAVDRSSVVGALIAAILCGEVDHNRDFRGLRYRGTPWWKKTAKSSFGHPE